VGKGKNPRTILRGNEWGNSAEREEEKPKRDGKKVGTEVRSRAPRKGKVGRDRKPVSLRVPKLGEESERPVFVEEIKLSKSSKRLA